MIRGRQAVGVFLGDHFTLLRDAHPARERARRQRFQEKMRGTRAASHRPAASMKERQSYVVGLRDFGV